MGTTLLLLVQWAILLSFYTFWLLALQQPDHRQLSWIADLRGRLKFESSKETLWGLVWYLLALLDLLLRFLMRPNKLFYACI